jgi:hypothetical protein
MMTKHCAALMPNKISMLENDPFELAINKSRVNEITSKVRIDSHM